MKANLPKSYLSLPQREKKIISDLMEKTLNDTIDREEAEIQRIWLQWACLVLHDAFGFGKYRLMLFLGNWAKMYRKNRLFKDDIEQQKFLDERIKKIFKNEYPDDFVKKL